LLTALAFVAVAYLAGLALMLRFGPARVRDQLRQARADDWLAVAAFAALGVLVISL
jgi:hypothetical protein